MHRRKLGDTSLSHKGLGINVCPIEIHSIPVSRPTDPRLKKQSQKQDPAEYLLIYGSTMHAFSDVDERPITNNSIESFHSRQTKHK